MVADADCEPVAVTAPPALTLVLDVTDAVDVPLLVLELLALLAADGVALEPELELTDTLPDTVVVADPDTVDTEIVALLLDVMLVLALPLALTLELTLELAVPLKLELAVPLTLTLDVRDAVDVPLLELLQLLDMSIAATRSKIPTRPAFNHSQQQGLEQPSSTPH